MSAPQFTPGPWAYRPRLANETTPFIRAGDHTGEWEVVCEDDKKVVSEDPWFIADVCDGAPGSSEANARLIAAAPELYEALEDLAERMMGAFPSLADTPEACRAKSALAKARGETA